MRGNITIRPAQAEDAAAIAAVLRDVGWFAHINGEPPTATESRVSRQLALNADGDSHTVLVAVDANGVVAGYVAVHWFPNLMKGADGYISELFLREAARGQGIGSTLLDAAKAEAIKRGVNRLMLFNSTKSIAKRFKLRMYPSISIRPC
jgi:L-amino acid N-acyltransferase YncA